MAGHRRAKGDPVATKKRAQSRRVRMLDALGAASTPAGQITAVTEYARASAVDLGEQAASGLATEVVAAVQAITDRYLTKEGRL